jgi:hypothetical protein
VRSFATGDTLEALREHLQEEFSVAEVSNVSIEDPGLGEPLVLGYDLEYELHLQTAGSRFILKPMRLMGEFENPFTPKTRTAPIDTKFASTVFHTLILELPEGWVIESVPDDLSIRNDAGRCAAMFDAQPGVLRVQRQFIIEKPMFTKDEYESVKQLFERTATLQEEAVVLRTGS